MVAYIVHVFTIIITLLNIFFFNIEKVFCINSRGLKLTLSYVMLLFMCNKCFTVLFLDVQKVLSEVDSVHK